MSEINMNTIRNRSIFLLCFILMLAVFAKKTAFSESGLEEEAILITNRLQFKMGGGMQQISLVPLPLEENSENEVQEYQQKEFILSDYEENQSYETYIVYVPSGFQQDIYIILPCNDTAIINGMEYRSGAKLAEGITDRPIEVTILDKENESNIVQAIVRFMFSENVPSLFISTTSGSIQSVNSSANHSTSERATFNLLDAQGNIINIETGIIKGRGNSTWTRTEIKKPYNIELDHNVSFFGMEKQKKWSLLANLFDGSELRNKIALDFSVLLEMPFAVESQYVNLYLNGKYNGLYLLTQHIDIGGGNVHIHNLGKETNILNDFKNKRPELVEETDGEKYISYYKGEDPIEISGGYLLEFLKNINIGSGGPWFETSHQHILIESPKYPTKAEAYYIAEYIRTVEDAIWNEDDEYKEYIDIDSWTSMYLIREFFEAWDSDINSSYLFKEIKDPIIYAGPAWDFDLSMGQTWMQHSMFTNQVIWLEGKEFSWLNRLVRNHPDFEMKVREKYITVFAPAVDFLIESYIEYLYSQIHIAAEMDYVRYPAKDRNQYPGTFQEEYDFLRKWIVSRKLFFDDYIDHRDDYITITFCNSADDNRFVYFLKPGETIKELPKEQGNEVVWIYESGEQMELGDTVNKSIVVTIKKDKD